MNEFFQTYQNDIFIIGILVVEIILFIILGINTLKKTRSLANAYFSAVFFMIVGLSTINVVIRFLSIEIENKGLLADSTLVKLYLDFVSIVTAAMVVILIIFGVGFYIINFGEKFYRDRKLVIVFIVLVILIGGSIIASRLLPEGLELGIQYDDSPYYEEYFLINPVLAIYLGVISLIFVVLDTVLLLRILPETDNKVQKRKLFSLLLVIVTYFLGLVNLIVVDMHLVVEIESVEKAAWNYLPITSVLFLFSMILLYFSIIWKRKTAKLDEK